jgi:Mor family transcriptional regulator
MEVVRLELLSDIEAHATEIIKDHGIAQEIAEQAGVAIADFLADHWGGQNVSFPKDYQYKLASRDLQIYRRFNGSNYHTLVKETGMTERGLRKLLDRVHRREQNRLQPRLFDDLPEA